MHAGPVTDFMARELITFSPDTEILHAIETLNNNKISGAPVLDDRWKSVGYGR
jgi:CBS domain-containing protein